MRGLFIDLLLQQEVKINIEILKEQFTENLHFCHYVFIRWSVAVHRTVLELHSETELHHSVKHLKQLRLDLKHQTSPRSCDLSLQDRTHHNLIWDQIYTLYSDQVFTGAAELTVLASGRSGTLKWFWSRWVRDIRYQLWWEKEHYIFTKWIFDISV